MIERTKKGFLEVILLSRDFDPIFFFLFLDILDSGLRQKMDNINVRNPFEEKTPNIY